MDNSDCRASASVLLLQTNNSLIVPSTVDIIMVMMVINIGNKEGQNMRKSSSQCIALCRYELTGFSHGIEIVLLESYLRFDEDNDGTGG